MNAFRLCFATLPVRSLEEAERFYVDRLGFEVTRRYPPTRWISLGVDENGGGFGLIESDAPPTPGCALDLFVPDVDAYWATIGVGVDVVSPPGHTPWGSYKAVIRDPSGNKIGFVQTNAPEEGA